MVKEVIWSGLAKITFAEVIEYLGQNFSDKEIRKFSDRVNQKLLVIQSHPRMGRMGGKSPKVYKTVLHKRIDLIYQYKPRKNEILLLSFWNTLQNPKRLKI